MSITRTYPHIWRFASLHQAYNTDGTPAGAPVKLNRTLTSNSDVTYGNNFKDWRQRLANGSDCTTGLTGHRRGNIVQRGGSVTQFNVGKRKDVFTGDLALTSNLTRFVDPSTSTDAVANTRAKSKFLSHYIKARDDWRGGNFLAEVRETLHALRNPVKSLYQATWSHVGKIGKLRKIYKKDPVFLRKHLADAHLGYTFGIRPLVSDINDATVAFNNVGSHEGAHDTHRVSGFGRNTSIATSSVPADAFGYASTSVDLAWESRVKNDNTVRYTAGIRATSGTNRQDLQRIGMDIFDVPSALWEATWMSFLVDYFANVGEMIDSWRLWDANVSWCKVTVRNSTTVNVTNLHVVPHPTTPFYTYSVGGNPGFYGLSQYVSRAATSIPYPDFHFQMPGFPDMRWLNVSALASQMFGKGRIKGVDTQSGSYRR